MMAPVEPEMNMAANAESKIPAPPIKKSIGCKASACQ